MRSYNLFRLKGEEGLCCAVPESHAVPTFVTGNRWTFGGKVEEKSKAMPGFDGKAAATSVRFNGFYLFQTMDRPASISRSGDTRPFRENRPAFLKG